VKSDPHSEDARASEAKLAKANAACPREGGEQCEHTAEGVYRGAADGGGVAGR